MIMNSPSISPSGSENRPQIREDHVLNSSAMLSRDTSSPELVEEIAMLEFKIADLERYLLSLYRTAFQQHFPSSSGSHEQLVKAICPCVESDQPSQETRLEMSKDYIDSSPKSAIDVAQPAISKLLSRKLQEQKSVFSSVVEKIGNNGADDALVSPDILAEDIIRTMFSIYCKLVNPTQTNNGVSVSSNSSACSSSTFSSRGLSESWSPPCGGVTEIGDSEGPKQDEGPYSSLVEVLEIRMNGDSYKYAVTMLQKFRSLIKLLETVDLTKMRREQKLAFWINIHNALVMHSYLAYGIQSYRKSTSILKATYNVGGQCVNAYDIQRYILGIKTHYRAKWLQTLLSPGKKMKSETTKHVFTIQSPEPLVHFSLCSGSYSDPVVRIYTAKSVFHDLKVAMEEYIRERVEVDMQTKIHLPKILKYYARDKSLSISELLEAVSECLSATQQETIRTVVKGRPEKFVNWVEQSSLFRYLIHKEVST